ncbi:3-oxoacid CoA-transferase subunit B [Variovorax sp. KK3]|uniref:3-oxoacid CoA-transferase subunit B n=1 Tax=Variovorax sp. KK3 TaxID=1855728 RepID=UPI00097C0ABA|nr:3-oxoacid CoA-transferase subunit B [Variovorax sp. KK3]
MNSLSRQELARLVARHLPPEGFVNLGIGAPTAIADHLPAGSHVMLHSENGILNVGPKPSEGQEDGDLINAGKMPVTLARGGSYFDSSLSFSMMRGGHLDIAILGAFQVSEHGDLANWSTGDLHGAPPAIGGAIDLAVGARQIWVMMDHSTRDAQPRLVQRCTLPLTAVGVVTRVFTNLAIVGITNEGFVLEALFEQASVEEVQQRTGALLSLSPEMRRFGRDGVLVPA